MQPVRPSAIKVSCNHGSTLQSDDVSPGIEQVAANTQQDASKLLLKLDANDKRFRETEQKQVSKNF